MKLLTSGITPSAISEAGIPVSGFSYAVLASAGIYPKALIIVV